jgi:hypothetical protein
MDPVNINAHFIEIGVSFVIVIIGKNSKVEDI